MCEDGDDGLLEPSDDLPISDQIQTTRVDWLRSLLGSVYEAGLTELSPNELDESGQLDSPRLRNDGWPVRHSKPPPRPRSTR